MPLGCKGIAGGGERRERKSEGKVQGKRGWGRTGEKKDGCSRKQEAVGGWQTAKSEGGRQGRRRKSRGQETL